MIRGINKFLPESNYGYNSLVEFFGKLYGFSYDPSDPPSQSIYPILHVAPNSTTISTSRISLSGSNINTYNSKHIVILPMPIYYRSVNDGFGINNFQAFLEIIRHYRSLNNDYNNYYFIPNQYLYASGNTFYKSCFWNTL